MNDRSMLTDLKSQRVEAPAGLSLLSRESLIDLVAAEHQLEVTLTDPALMTLTARHPYDPVGHMDYFMPGRWDTELDLVFMDAIVDGPSPGMWDGTAGYIRFTAPTDGNFLVAVNFSGYQTTMSLNGPWGTNTARTATPQDNAAVLALWSGKAGEDLYCTVSCKQDSGSYGIGYLQSFEVHKV